MLMKLIGILVTVGVIWQGTKLGAKQLGFVVDFAKVAGTQADVGNISNMIYADLVVSNDFQLPRQSEEWWADYLREHFHSKDLSRDTSKDMWQKAYVIRKVNNGRGKNSEGFEVRSAGPDTTMETGDDIVVFTPCQ
jgi:hypothetical protein